MKNKRLRDVVLGKVREYFGYTVKPMEQDVITRDQGKTAIRGRQPGQTTGKPNSIKRDGSRWLITRK